MSSYKHKCSQMISATCVARSTSALMFFTTKVAIRKERTTPPKKLKLAIRKEVAMLDN